MCYITEIGLTSRFFQAKLAHQLVYHKNSGTIPLNVSTNTLNTEEQHTPTYSNQRSTPFDDLDTQTFIHTTLYPMMPLLHLR